MTIPLIIGISGVRGIIGENLSPVEATKFGMAYGTFLNRAKVCQGRPKVCIGRDSRPSGPMLAAAVSAGLMATGCQVVDLSLVTTPGVALMTRFVTADGGMVITASHNPSQWNGIKFLRHDGIAYPAEQVRQIHQYYHDQNLELQDAAAVGSAAFERRTHPLHVKSILQICDQVLIASKRFKVVLDSVNGAGCVVTADLLSTLGCEVVHLNSRPTGFFAHTPEPTAENLAELGPEVCKHGAAVGFAQDPDADRLVIIDEQGRFIGEEYTLALAVKYLLHKRKGSVAVNLSTSRMIDDLAEQAGSTVIRTPVGEAHVANAMMEYGCVIGGEGNGGVIDLRVVPVRNSLVGIALILQLMAETGKTISQFVEEIPRHHMIKTKFPCPSRQSDGVFGRVQAHYRALSTGARAEIDTRDGIRIDLPQGWVQLRASNTEPILRLIAESTDPATSKKLTEEVRAVAQV